MKNREICCTYRSPLNILSLIIAAVFFVGTLWATVKLQDIRPGIVTVAVFLCTMCLVLRIANQRVVLAQEKIIVYGLCGKKTEYDLRDITKIAVANQTHTKYIKLFSGDRKILVRKDIKNYDEFLKEICDRFQIKGYTRAGLSEFVVKL